MYKSILIILLCFSALFAARQRYSSYWEWGPRVSLVFVDADEGGLGGGIHFKNDFHKNFQFCPNIEFAYAESDNSYYDPRDDVWYNYSIFETSINWDLKLYPIRGSVCPYFGMGLAAPIMTRINDNYDYIYQNDVDFGANLLFGIDFDNFFLELKNKFSGYNTFKFTFGMNL